jgi:O-antigen ligase
VIRQLDHGMYDPEARTAAPLVAWVVLSIIMLCGLVDLPRQLTLGPVTLLAPLTGAYASSVWILWILSPIFVRPAIVTLWPLVALLMWSYASFLWYKLTVSGLQNVLVLTTFVGLALLVSYHCYRAPRFAERIRTTVVRAVWLAAALYVVSFFSAVAGFGQFMSSRAFALVAMLGVACHLGTWRHNRQPLGLWQAVLLTLLIGVSLSRAALFAALILFPLSRLSLKHPSSWVRVALLTAFLAMAAYLAVTYIEPLNERFFAGDQAYEVGEVTINTSGRTEMWSAVWDSYLEAPLTGLGAGSSEEVLYQLDPNASGHPHNDYLRFLHDYGPLGLGLWCWGFLCLLWTVGKSWVGASRRGDNPEASLHLAALLSLAGLALTMITDNVIVYVFVMAPLGALIGASLGSGAAQLRKRV